MNRFKHLVVLAVFGAATEASHAATFIVSNTSDSGLGSLRQAILDADTTPGKNLIQFNLPGSSVQTIAPLTSLPLVTNSVIIDGYSQPGSSPNTLANSNNAVLLVRLDGVNLTNGFPIGLCFSNANNNAVRGLVIVRFYTGIQLYASSGNTIAGNWIGLDVDGIARGNLGTGLEVTCAVFNRSTGNMIGGTTPGDRNVISGNRAGVSFFPTSADHNSVQGNFIGTDTTGSLPRGNFFEGVLVQNATNILIGGTNLGARNLICANSTGVSLLNSSGDAVQGNFIGTDVTGHYDLGNTGDGIDAQGCAFVMLGGTNAGNLVVNSSGYGISLLGCSTNVIQGNWVGTDLGGTWPLGNGKDGIYLQGSSATMIGGGSPGLANVIEFNNGAGVNISSGQNNTVSGNSIFDNAGLGINLGTGANNSQNPPAIAGAVIAWASTQIQGTIESLPSTSYRIEFFASPPWDATSTPEGEIYLGATVITTTPSGEGDFSASLPVAAPSHSVITATATDPVGNTSEFSSGASVTSGVQGVALSIIRDGDTTTISWPSAAVGFRLQTTGSLKCPISWQDVIGGISSDGLVQSFVVSNLSQATNQFFRLKR